MARFLTAIDGSRGKPLLSRTLYEEMLAPPHAPLKPRANGTHFGLGWDVVRAEHDGIRYSKNGGMPGVHAQIEHLPNGVDWVVLLNGGARLEGEPSVLGYCTKRLRHEIEKISKWPRRDLFKAPRPMARLPGTQTAGL